MAITGVTAFCRMSLNIRAFSIMALNLRTFSIRLGIRAKQNTMDVLREHN
jgi:hypothetical protein